MKQCDEKNKISLDAFYKLWNHHLDHIKVLTPRTDVCKTCRLMTREIVEKRNKLSLIEHQNLAENLSQHLQIVKLEREFYKTCISNASKHVSDSENFLIWKIVEI